MNSVKITASIFLIVLASSFLTTNDNRSTSGLIHNIHSEDTLINKNKGTGPRHWIAYEYCWVNNKPMPEKNWKANIDWVIANFKSFGYDMVSNDGWIENAQTINTHGYITKYNDSWINGFAYWSDYLKKRDMKLGVYYNPMWLTKAAFNQNVTVEGTGYQAKDIAGKTPFNVDLYWVDVALPGAKEWIQGYVNYFIDLGATYLRIDFLENYEKNYGTAKYAQALQWIKEAAADRILLSLVMPNCYNHAQTELQFGDMIRIDDDCFNGGWDFVSNRKRGTWQPHWPQYGNAFDGFVSFADIGGRGQMILDGDFIRLNTLSNDTERKFQVSLFVMAGSPITIADQYNTIGNSAWVYQNKELLDLNDQGFAGKPFSFDTKDGYNSSRWMGQLPDGDWIVGLFNRESTSQTSGIDFVKELGLQPGDAYKVRDLWAHTDLGNLPKVYSTNLAAHDCRILKIKNSVDPKYEAEVASMIGGAKKSTAHSNYSGPGFVGNFETAGAKVLYAVNVAAEGNYVLKAAYANASENTGTATVYVNNEKVAGQLMMPRLSSWNDWGIAEKKVYLKAGVNYMAVQYDPGDNGFFHLDYIQLAVSR
jgi:glucan 1,6-alpha-isomaltosidase